MTPPSRSFTEFDKLITLVDDFLKILRQEKVIVAV